MSSRLFTITGSDYPRISSSEQETNIPKWKKTNGSLSREVLLKNMSEQAPFLCKKDLFAPRNNCLYHWQAPMQNLYKTDISFNIHGFATYLKLIDWLTSSQLVRQDPTHSVYLRGYFYEAGFYYKWYCG